jgi:hypothetical protein
VYLVPQALQLQQVGLTGFKLAKSRVERNLGACVPSSFITNSRNLASVNPQGSLYEAGRSAEKAICQIVAGPPSWLFLEEVGVSFT